MVSADEVVIDSHLLHRTDSIADAVSGQPRRPLDEGILKDFRDCKILFQRTLDRVFVPYFSTGARALLQHSVGILVQLFRHCQ